jgi:Cu2+-exporting ATPase
MNAELQVLQRGRGRAWIVGGRAGSAEAGALEAWLADRVDVVRVERRARALQVEYEDGTALPGRFLRALRDEVFTLNRSRVVREPFGVTPVGSSAGRVRLRVTGVDERELAGLTMAIAGLPGVKRTRHHRGSRTTLVLYDPGRVSEELIVDAVRKIDRAELGRDWQPPAPVRWGGAASGTLVLVTCLTRAVPFPWLALGITLNSLRPLARSIAALGEGRAAIDLLDVAATFAALATRRPTTAAFVIWMVGVGDLLLDVSAREARSALSTLLQGREREALRLLADGELESVEVRDLRVGDRFVVHGGHAIVADGRVVAGLAEVDEKALTGESHLLSKRPGAPVFASTVVAEGYLVVEVESCGGNTEAAKIERILCTVGSKPLTLQRETLDFASMLVAPTFGVAWLAAALSGDSTRAVCVLITDFGTGIRIAVPTSALTAMALAAREGVLVKGAQYLERLAKADVIVFDKTGTLTSGVPEVVEVVAGRGTKASTLIALCASAEARYDHPVAKALRSYAKARGIAVVAPEPGSVEYVVGLGLTARVGRRRVRLGRAAWMEKQNLTIGPTYKAHLARFRRERVSTLCVAIDDKVVGLVAYSDGTRPESAATVRRLRARGRRRVVLLSGDSPEVVSRVAHDVGIDEAVGGLLPEEKAEYVRRMRAAGGVVAMVGDGLNDVPALASADVGISMAGSADVALETADVVLLEGGLSRLERAFRIGDRAMASVRRNLGLIIAPNAIAIALGAFGLISPPIAALINNGATILAVLVGTVPLLDVPAPRPRRDVGGAPARALAPRRDAPDPTGASHPPLLFPPGPSQRG